MLMAHHWCKTQYEISLFLYFCSHSSRQSLILLNGQHFLSPWCQAVVYCKFKSAIVLTYSPFGNCNLQYITTCIRNDRNYLSARKFYDLVVIGATIIFNLQYYCVNSCKESVVCITWPLYASPFILNSFWLRLNRNMKYNGKTWSWL